MTTKSNVLIKWEDCLTNILNLTIIPSITDEIITYRPHLNMKEIDKIVNKIINYTITHINIPDYLMYQLYLYHASFTNKNIKNLDKIKAHLSQFFNKHNLLFAMLIMMG